MLRFLLSVSCALATAMQPDMGALKLIFEDALARRVKQYGNDDTRSAQAARDLGLFLKRFGTAAEARGALRQAVEMDAKALGPGALETLRDAAELAAISPPEQAQPLWQRASASAEPAVASTAFSALAALRAAAGDRTGAAQLLAQAYEKQKAARGAESPQAAASLEALAMAVSPKAGVALMRQVLAIDTRTLGPGHPETATAATNLAGLLINAGNVDAAIPLLTDAVAVFERTFGHEHPRVASACAVLAYAKNAKGDRAAAEKLYRRALSINENAYGPRHNATLASVKDLAGFFRTAGRAKDAAELERRLH